MKPLDSYENETSDRAWERLHALIAGFEIKYNLKIVSANATDPQIDDLAVHEAINSYSPATGD